MNDAQHLSSHIAAYAQRLAEIEYLRAPAIQGAIDALDPSPGSRGLDVGCGIGLHTCLLGKKVGSAGHVTGLDRSSAFLDLARQRAAAASLEGHTTFRQGDLTALDFADGAFDWLWCNDALWPGPAVLGCSTEEPLPVVRGFARVVQPGRKVALVYWSSQKLLPGYPVLEARLNATSQPSAPFYEGMRPEQHCMRALGWLASAGLRDLEARTVVAQVQAPLEPLQRRALEVTLDMFWGQAQNEVSAEDWALYQRLRQPDSAECILDAPDYYAFLTYTIFWGRVV